MSLAHAILGFLSYSPKTGYDLKKRMMSSTAFFWHAELAQIYPTLKRLEKSGLIKSEIEPQNGKPDKRIYTITESGRAELHNWLCKPLDNLPFKKDSVLLQLFFSGGLDKATLLEQLYRQLELHTTRLEHLQQDAKATIQVNIANTGLQREGLLWELVREFGEGQEQHYIRWLKHAIEVIEVALS